MSEQELICSFCGKSRYDVRRMITAGESEVPPVICDECVDLCNGIIAEEAGETNEREADEIMRKFPWIFTLRTITLRDIWRETGLGQETFFGLTIAGFIRACARALRRRRCRDLSESLREAEYLLGLKETNDLIRRASEMTPERVEEIRNEIAALRVD